VSFLYAFCARARVCVCVCVRANVRVRLRVRARARVCVFSQLRLYVPLRTHNLIVTCNILFHNIVGLSYRYYFTCMHVSDAHLIDLLVMLHSNIIT
jgi:hypothetical protein